MLLFSSIGIESAWPRTRNALFFVDTGHQEQQSSSALNYPFCSGLSRRHFDCTKHSVLYFLGLKCVCCCSGSCRSPIVVSLCSMLAALARRECTSLWSRSHATEMAATRRSKHGQTEKKYDSVAVLHDEWNN